MIGGRKGAGEDEVAAVLSRDSWRYPEVVGEWVAKSRDSWRGAVGVPDLPGGRELTGGASALV